MPPEQKITPLISIIIPVYNGSQTLPGCLQALQQQSRPADEIIVVDDGSTDETAAIAAHFGVNLISQANAGPAAARNHGAQVACGDILLFTDADCAPTSTWVARMVAPFADPTVAGAKGEYRTRQRGLVARFVQQEYQERYDRMAGQAQIDFVDTYAAAYRRPLFLAAGGFDPTFLKNEDQEFSFRLAGQGYRLVYVPGAVVYHQHDGTLAEYMQRKYWIGYWKAFVTRRYPAKLVHDSHTPPVLKAQVGLALLGAAFLLSRGLFSNRLAGAGARLAWDSLLLSGLPLYLKILQRDAPVLGVAPVLLVARALALGAGFLLGSLRLIFDKAER
jgi:glycosyltransferase involved in cell wall biosynthesis